MAYQLSFPTVRFSTTTLRSPNVMLQNAAIFFRLANRFNHASQVEDDDPDGSGANRRLSQLFANKNYDELERVIRQKIHNGDITAADFAIDKRVITIAEACLTELHPTLDLSDDPAHQILSGSLTPDLNNVVTNLLSAQELEKISAQDLEENSPKLAEVERKLAKLYPDLDLETDPAVNLLQGTWRKKLRQFIQRLFC